MADSNTDQDAAAVAEPPDVENVVAPERQDHPATSKPSYHIVDCDTGAEVFDDEDDSPPRNDNAPTATTHNRDIDNDKNDQEEAMVVTETTAAADLFQPREGRDLTWSNLNVTLLGAPTSNKCSCCKEAEQEPDNVSINNNNNNNHKTAEADRKLLDGAWGEVPAKQVTGIMGPSGSGAYSFITVLLLFLDAVCR